MRAEERWVELQKIVQQVKQAMIDMGQALAPAMETLIGAAHKAYEAIWTAYLECGAIYGETHEGMMRWLKEVGEIARYEEEAERIRQHHAMLAQIKKIGRTNGNTTRDRRSDQ